MRNTVTMQRNRENEAAPGGEGGFHQTTAMPTKWRTFVSSICRKEGQEVCALAQRHSRCRAMCGRVVQPSVEACEEEKTGSVAARQMEVRMLGVRMLGSCQGAPV